MNKKNIIILITIVAMMNFASDLYAQTLPEAVLVQLRSEHNRIQALTKDGRYKEVAIVKKDALGVANAMISDFQNHFSFCPVYYYMDTNLDLVKQKKFDGILMNADGTPAKNLIINETSKKYFIVYYGYAIEQSKAHKIVTDPEKYQTNSGTPRGKGLIINNGNFYQVAYLYKFDYENFSFKVFRNRKYYYISRHYDMEYFPFAKEFNNNLVERKNKVHISHVNPIFDDLFDRE